MEREAVETSAVQRIVYVSSPGYMHMICEPGVQAVICDEQPLPVWFSVLQKAVRSGAFHVQRTFSDYLAVDESANYLERILPTAGVEAHVRRALIEDVVRLVCLCQSINGGRRFRIRCMTSFPNHEHGFHVDVAHASPCRRILRVYGKGTEYVRPEHIGSYADFFRHLDKRHMLAKQIYAQPRATGSQLQRLRQRLADHEKTQNFLHSAATIEQTPTGATVAIESVQARMLWPAHILAGRAAGWVHRSPMSGDKRLVVSISNAPLH